MAGGFGAGVKWWGNKVIGVELPRHRRELILRLFRAVIYDTPVLEGTLRANWRCSSNSATTTAIALRPVGAVIAEIESVLDGGKLSDTVYLSNSLPYAYGIEYLGKSHTKAPDGMLRKNVARFQQIARRAGNSQ